MAMETDLNKTLPDPRIGGADNVESQKNLQTCPSVSSSSPAKSESEHRIKHQQRANSTDNFSSNEQSPITPRNRIDSGSGSEAATQYPQTQMMDRADDATSPAYRIPSHVFSRNKSTTPADWSGASNESLFSIQMGNMSFTREQMQWLGKSGELGRPGEIPFDLSQPSNRKQSDGADSSMSAIEARAAETMREVIREHSENQRKETSSLTESSSQSAISHKSGSSTKSFHFPILGGDGGKSISLKGEDHQKPKEETKSESPNPTSNPQTPKESSSDEPPKPAATKRWYSRFSCCPLRS